MKPEPFLRICANPRLQALVDLVGDILDGLLLLQALVRRNGVIDKDFISKRPGLMDQRRHDRQIAKEREMGRPGGSQRFLSQEIRKNPCLPRVLVTEKPYEIALLQAAQHISDATLVLHHLPRHGAILTKKLVEFLILLLHSHRKKRIAIERQRRAFYFPVAAVGRCQDAALPALLDGVQLFLPMDRHMVFDIFLRE